MTPFDQCNTEPQTRQKVAVFITGGTIVCDFDVETSRILPAKSGQELLSGLPWIKKICDVKLIEFCNIPSSHLTPEIGVELASAVKRELESESISGAVVVQGTDTLEEIAYLLDLIVDSEKPIVFTGSMKSTNELYVDAPGNLCGALRLAASQEARGYGVLVYFNQQIHSARYVTKNNSNNVDSFKSTESGPLGVINDASIKFFTKPLAHKKFRVNALNKNIQLIKAFCGMDTLLLDSCMEAAVDGLVIEALGAGNLPPNVFERIKKAIAKGIPTVIVTRCSTGFAVGIYDYSGGGARLKEIGAIFGEDLSGLKARIRLMVLCQVGDVDFVTRNFAT